MTTQKLPPRNGKARSSSGRLVRRFFAGQLVKYINHITGHDLGALQIETVDPLTGITAKRLHGGNAHFRFHLDGQSKWSSNLSIRPA